MMPLPPNPPAQLLEGVGTAGEEGRAGACDTEQPPQLGCVQVRGPGWGGLAQQDRREKGSHRWEGMRDRGALGRAEMEAKEL